MGPEGPKRARPSSPRYRFPTKCSFDEEPLPATTQTPSKVYHSPVSTHHTTFSSSFNARGLRDLPRSALASLFDREEAGNRTCRQRAVHTEIKYISPRIRIVPLEFSTFLGTTIRTSNSSDMALARFFTATILRNRMNANMPRVPLPHPLIGGAANQSAFVSFILFVILFSLPLIPFVYPFRAPNARTYTFAIGPGASSIDGVVIYSIRTPQSPTREPSGELAKEMLICQLLSCIGVLITRSGCDELISGGNSERDVGGWEERES